MTMGISKNFLRLWPAFALLWVLMLSVSAVFAGTLDVSLAKNNLILTARHGGDGSAWGMPNCKGCHVLTVIHKKAPKIRDIVEDKGYSTCSGCHGSNGTGLAKRCGICHNAQDLPAKPFQTGAHQHDFKVKRTRPLADKDCQTCHKSSDMDGQFELNVDLTRFRDAAGQRSGYKTESEFCTRCHNRSHQQPGFRIRNKDLKDPLVAMEDNYAFIDMHGWPQASGVRTYAGLREGGYRYGDVKPVNCTDCHAMHGTRNSKLILDDSRKGMVKLNRAFRFQPPKNIEVFDTAEIVVNGKNYAQLCVMCHDMQTIVEDGALDTGNGLSGVHDVRRDCTECHVHGGGAQGTGL